MPFSRTTATAAMAAAQLPKGNNPVVDLLTRVPVNRGSLVKSIENLLKTIEMSENAVMIPTLLRDKVRVDAWELLFVAKILKASILGHGDLVEFYMNHLNSDQQEAQLKQEHQQKQQEQQLQQQQQQQQQQLNLLGSPLLQHNIIYEQQSPPNSSSSAGSISSQSTFTSTSTATDGNPAAATQRATAATATTTTSSSSSGSGTSASWATASQLPQQQQQQGAQAPGSSAASTCSALSSCAGSSSTSSTANNGNQAGQSKQQQHETNGVAEAARNRLLKADFVGELAQQTAQEALLAARPLLVQQQQQQQPAQQPQAQQRQAQPPSLLQLTTTNNHINSLLQYPDPSPVANGPPAPIASAASATVAEQHQQLTISTAAANGRAAELRPSRSAGCLFRQNSSSGASSPRTPMSATNGIGGGGGLHQTAPNTPLAGAADPMIGSTQGELPGDLSALVKLLMQIEQLKSSIAHVSGQLESVVELYKRSIDNIST